jgi:hypothetical protein
VLNALALECRGSAIALNGFIPEQEQAREIVLATGLPKAFRLRVNLPPGFSTFELANGKREAPREHTSSAKEVQTVRLTDYIDSCLSDFEMKLSDDTKRYISRLVGEVLTNAEEHAGTDGEWWLAGYFRRMPGAAHGDFHLTIFNLGTTLAGSLQELPLDARMRTEIEKLVAEHGNRGLLGPKWTHESLWTVYALQEGVTRFNVEQGVVHGHRGLGTAELIDMFDLLGQSTAVGAKPRMCVVSGRTHVVFDGTYVMKRHPIGGQLRRVIAFNAENDLAQPPDPAYVRSLRQGFPGTMVSLRFYLDRDYLREIGGP